MVVGDIVVIAPFMDTHLLAGEIDGRRLRWPTSLPWHRRSIEMAASWPCATAQMMFFGQRRIAAEEHKWIGGLHGGGIDLGHVPFVELNPNVALDPGKGVFLAYRTNTSSHS